MFLQRLKQLWSRVVSRLTARLRSSSTDLQKRDGQTAGATYPRSNATPGIPSGGFASGRWLDDNRRMRPQLTKSTEGWVARDRQAQISRSLRPDSSKVASPHSRDGEDEPGRPSYEQSAPAASREDESASLLPIETGDENSNDTDSTRLGDEESRRRLLGLKYLVRLGIYNEGFDASGTPDQYQHSLGMDESED
jgi:hypothetical protein